MGQMLLGAMEDVIKDMSVGFGYSKSLGEQFNQRINLKGILD